MHYSAVPEENYFLIKVLSIFFFFFKFQLTLLFRQTLLYLAHFSKIPTTNVFRRIATMILHAASENIVIFIHKWLKENGKKSNTDHSRLQ